MWYYISSYVGIYCVCHSCLIVLGIITVMDENKEKTLQAEEQENRRTFSRDTSRHTWIGDVDEMGPDEISRTVKRMTQTIPGTEIRSTRMVEKQRKAYKGFITDEEVKDAEDRAEAERRARAEERNARLDMAQTRIYSGLGSGLEDESAEPEEERKPVRVRRTYSINLSDGKVRKRLIALAVIFALMLLFDIGYLFLDRSAAGLPGRTESVQKETADVLAENEELQQTADNLGDYEQLKELRDSWQRLKEQIEE